MDGIAMEAYIYGGLRLMIHVCLLFNLCIKHGYLPKGFMNSEIVPLVKCKSGDLSDVNNFRAIAISTSLSKLFEHVVAASLHTVDNESDKYQFGFKSGHSTSLCTGVLKRTVDYYINKGSHVFACFVDFSKAFDNVNYWKLFNKLLDDNISSSIIRVLAYWYSNQDVCVRWHSTISTSFSIGNGTRQGGVLSPFLFTRYIRDMLSAMASSKLGCNVGGLFVNVLAYADDLVLLAPSWRALQSLLDLLLLNIVAINITCNVNKSVCMVFNPRNRTKIVAKVFPQLHLGGCQLQFVPVFKYLGHMICNDLSDDCDIKREIRSMFYRTNLLVRRFFHCSVRVKIVLFRAYCICLYDSSLWKHYNAGSISKLTSCYNKCLKTFFGFKRRDSLTGILLHLSLPSFNTILYNGHAIFQRCYSSSKNGVVEHLFSLGY